MAEEAKPTSGPRKAERVKTSAGHVWRINPIDGCIYVDTGGGVCRKDASGAEADARLIAAAPDMLEALQWIAECGTDYQSICKAKSAIAKVKGLTPPEVAMEPEPTTPSAESDGICGYFGGHGGDK